MIVFESIKQKLADNDIKYDLIEHEQVFTSEEAANVRGVSLDIGAKALVFLADKKPILTVVPANKRAHTKKIKKLLGIKNLKMASREEVKELTTLEPGSIPPFGSIMDLPSYFDEEISQKEKVAFNPGSHTISVIMNAKDLISIEKPEIADIT